MLTCRVDVYFCFTWCKLLLIGKNNVVSVALSKPSKLVGLILLHKKANHINEILDSQGLSYKNALVCVPVCM